jgi:hypothetical protein
MAALVPDDASLGGGSALTEATGTTFQSQLTELRSLIMSQRSAGGGGRGTGGGETSQQVLRSNEVPNTVFIRFREMGVRTQVVKKRCEEQNIVWPRVGTNLFCPSYHIGLMCNSRCGRARDHCAHTAAQDNDLLPWLEANWHA